MAEIQKPPPAKFFIALLFADSAMLCRARDAFVSLWGSIDFEGENHEFDVTDYYVPEMGKPLYRRILAFSRLDDPSFLVEMKLECNSIESGLCIDNKRTVNCDAGYLDHNKVVLASAKEAGQKIYLAKGIYADLSGRYKAGKYQCFEWSFPDFKDGRYDAELLKIRELYLKQAKIYRQENT